MIDSNILITGSFIALFILIIVGVFFNKFPQKKYFKYFALFSLFFLTGEILRTFRVVIPDLFSIVIANTLMAFGIIFLYIGVRTLKASMIEININYPKSTDFLNTFIYSYLFFMSFWLSIILIIRAMCLPNNKNTINLEK